MIYGFMHIYTVNNWYEIVHEQIKKMHDSNLWVWMEHLFIGVNGDSSLENKLRFDPNKVTVLYWIDKPELEQSLTLSYIRFFASIKDGAKVFYVHTKGVSHYPSPPQTDWRHLMEYFVIMNHDRCVKELEDVDIVGVNWHLGEGHMGAQSKKAGGIKVTPHFSGNFWWATTEYLRRLPPLFPLLSKYQCEFWIGQNTPIVAELWNSGIHNHRHIYPESNYKGKKKHVKHYCGADPIEY